jgi:hypothetical protein
VNVGCSRGRSSASTHGRAAICGGLAATSSSAWGVTGAGSGNSNTIDLDVVNENYSNIDNNGSNDKDVDNNNEAVLGDAYALQKNKDLCQLCLLWGIV